MDKLERLSLPAVSETDVLLLVVEIEHRVANLLAAAFSAVSLAARCGPKPVASLEETARRLGGHADLHRILQAPVTPGSVDFREHLARIGEAAARAGLGGAPIQVALGERPIELDGWRCWLAGLVVTELIINAARHGSTTDMRAVSIAVLARGPQVVCRVANSAPVEAWGSPGRGSGIGGGSCSGPGRARAARRHRGRRRCHIVLSNAWARLDQDERRSNAAWPSVE
jgi:hypothetical protein